MGTVADTRYAPRAGISRLCVSLHDAYPPGRGNLVVAFADHSDETDECVGWWRGQFSYAALHDALRVAGLIHYEPEATHDQ